MTDKERLYNKLNGIRPKVYCSDCKCYKYEEWSNNNCKHNENVEYTHNSERREKSFITSPLKINGKNDCNWYAPNIFKRVGNFFK